MGWHFQTENIPTRTARTYTDSFRWSWMLVLLMLPYRDHHVQGGRRGVPLSADRSGVHCAYPVKPSKRRRIRYWVITFWNSFTKRALSGLGVASCCLLLLFTLCPTPTHPQESAEGPPPQGSPPWFTQSKAVASQLLNPGTAPYPPQSNCHYLPLSVWFGFMWLSCPLHSLKGSRG